MADLDEKNSAQAVKVVGADSSGIESNYIEVSGTGAVKVDGSAVTQPVSGTVTANAGTNLNTSALALETTQAAQSTLIGAVTETAPANDTASSGLNGRLQRIAQRLTSIFTALSDRTQKTQITNGTIDGEILATAALISSNGLVTRPIPYEPQTYSAAADGFVLAATPTDVFTITGSATKTIRIHKIRITGTTTSGSAIKLRVSILRRSTADSGGTRVAATVVTHDTTNAAGTATVGHYTANPTLGTLVGAIRSASIGITGSGLAGGDLIFDFVEPEGQPVVLRGTSEQVAVNFNSTSVTGSVISISIEWSEV